MVFSFAKIYLFYSKLLKVKKKMVISFSNKKQKKISTKNQKFKYNIVYYPDFPKKSSYVFFSQFSAECSGAIFKNFFDNWVAWKVLTIFLCKTTEDIISSQINENYVIKKKVFLKFYELKETEKLTFLS